MSKKWTREKAKALKNWCLEERKFGDCYKKVAVFCGVADGKDKQIAVAPTGQCFFISTDNTLWGNSQTFIQLTGHDWFSLDEPEIDVGNLPLRYGLHDPTDDPADPMLKICEGLYDLDPDTKLPLIEWKAIRVVPEAEIKAAREGDES